MADDELTWDQRILRQIESGIDVTQVDRNLKLTPTERLEQMEAMLRDLEEMRGTPLSKSTVSGARLTLQRVGGSLGSIGTIEHRRRIHGFTGAKIRMHDEAWTPDILLDHLQKAVYLELWTIPLYLTAAYSLQVPGSDSHHPPSLTPVRSPKNPNRSREQLAFNHIYSIVVQEMLHLELASNLFNALFAGRGRWPRFTGAWAPRYEQFPPWIGVKLPVQLGPADPTQMTLLATVETPEPHTDPPPSGPQDVYDSIGQFYKAIEQGIDQLWDQLYDPAANMRQQSEFANKSYPADDYTGFSATISGDSAAARQKADQVLQAIIGQGEGSRGPFIAADLRPEDLDDLEDRVSHFARFRMVQAMLKFGGPLRTYPTTGGSNLAAAQRDLDRGFTKLLVALEQGFAGTAELDLGSMWTLPGQIVAVWAAGGCPRFQYVEHAG